MLRPIHGNAGVQAWYHEQLLRLVESMRHDLRIVFAGYAEAIAPPAIAHDSYPRVRADGNYGCVVIAEDAPRNPSLIVRSALNRWGKRWVSKFDKLSLDLGKEFARRNFKVTQIQMQAALKEAGFTVAFKPTHAASAAYQAVVSEQVNLIKSIPQQYMKDVESKVWNSVMKGSDMHQLQSELVDTYKITRERAAVIARDQNNKAKATIEKTRRQELGITKAIWQHSAGGKVPRKTHVDMSGKTYDIQQGMWDADEGKHVMPGELINCRCTSRAVIEGFINSTGETAQQRRHRTVNIPAARARAR
jgi:Phage Mu protein F like protein